MNKKCMHGFTMIEAVLILTLIGIIIAVTQTHINFVGIMKTDVVTKYLADVSDIELALNNYWIDKSGYPPDTNGDDDLLDEESMVPTYLFAPKAPVEFDRDYATNGYRLSMEGTGIYICTRMTAQGDDMKNQAIQTIEEKLPQDKFFYNRMCPAEESLPNTLEDEIIYTTYYITR